MTKMIHKLLRLIPFFLVPISLPEASEGTGSGFALLTANTAYLSEGRDNLDGDSFFTATLAHEQPAGPGTAGLEVLYGRNPQGDYDEWNLTGGFSWSAGFLEMTTGYTYLIFPEDDVEDHEGFLGIAAGTDLLLVPFVSGVYSTESEGMFFETGLTGEWQLRPQLNLASWLKLGINQGYIPDGHDGLNHLEAGVSVRTPLTESLEIELYLVGVTAIDRDPSRFPEDQSLGDHVEGGLNIGTHF